MKTQKRMKRQREKMESFSVKCEREALLQAVIVMMMTKTKNLKRMEKLSRDKRGLLVNLAAKMTREKNHLSLTVKERSPLTHTLVSTCLQCKMSSR